MLYSNAVQAIQIRWTDNDESLDNSIYTQTKNTKASSLALFLVISSPAASWVGTPLSSNWVYNAFPSSPFKVKKTQSEKKKQDGKERQKREH